MIHNSRSAGVLLPSAVVFAIKFLCDQCFHTNMEVLRLLWVVNIMRSSKTRYLHVLKKYSLTFIFQFALNADVGPVNWPPRTSLPVGLRFLFLKADTGKIFKTDAVEIGQRGCYNRKGNFHSKLSYFFIRVFITVSRVTHTKSFKIQI
jgi:hypothetical protein